MPRILTVDDSRAIRTIVSKHVKEMGIEVDEAEDGEQGLVRLDEFPYDLVLLDVTMPNMDGPTMLSRMREKGHQTPVIMLTSESKRSIVAGVVKLGVEDYILKPFKPDELWAKVQKVLNAKAAPAVVDMPTGGPAAPEAPRAFMPSPSAAPAPMVDLGASMGGARQFVDILVVDDMENVAKKLRTMIPPHISLNGCVSAQTALNHCRERVYRVILIDTVIPDVNSIALMNQLRALQTHAAFLALALRTSNADGAKEWQQNGFADALFKPFDRESVDDFMMRYFDNQELVVTEDNVMKVGAFAGKEDRLDRYYQRVTSLLEGAVSKIASACYDEAIVDISGVPVRPDRTPRLVMDLNREATKMGLDLKVVASPECRRLLNSFAETAKVSVTESLGQARR